MINVYAKTDTDESVLIASFHVNNIIFLDRELREHCEIIWPLLKSDPHNDTLKIFYDKFRVIMERNRLDYRKYPKQRFTTNTGIKLVVNGLPIKKYMRHEVRTYIMLIMDNEVDITDDVIVGTYDQRELYKLTQSELLGFFEMKRIINRR